MQDTVEMEDLKFKRVGGARSSIGRDAMPGVGLSSGLYFSLKSQGDGMIQNVGHFHSRIRIDNREEIQDQVVT